MSDGTEPDLRSYGRPEWGPTCEMGGYCWGWLVMLSAPKDRDRVGGAEYGDQCMSSRDDGSALTGVVHVADGGGACGV